MKPIKPVSEPVVTDDGYVLETKTVAVGGKTWRFRELTVEETDQCRDLATTDKEYDARKMLRVMVSMSSVEPVLTLEQVVRAPQRLFGLWVDIVNDLADPDTLVPADSEGND